ncbi:MAG: type IX secretion system membrane protein PorP/SprF [Bacteroidales bacterium]|nr:type IX secretion system membrane protein PorP/SprF [Bacteroidales bacterium]
MSYQIKTIFIFYLSLVCLSAIAQQDPLYTQYINNQLTFNPAYAGSNEMLSAQLTGRNQWTGFNGRPATRVLTLHSPIGMTSTNLGLSYINDELGPVKNNSLYIDYAYRLRINNDGYLSLGIKGGFDMFNAYLTELPLAEPGDDAFLYDLEDSFMLNFGFGVYYVTPKYYVGFAIPRLIRSEVSSDDESLFNASDLNYYISAGAIFTLNNNLKLRPSFQSRLMLNTPAHMEAMVWGIYHDRLWLGLGYRLNDAVNAGIQLQVNDQIRVGYTYDMTTSRFNRYGGTGTHELTMCYDFRFRRKHIKTPRYF